jgi:hypothetical protein
MSRSSSASPSLPEDRHNGRRHLDGTKRPYVNCEILEVASVDGQIPQFKRSRIGVGYEALREPAFFILKRAGQPSAAPRCTYNDPGFLPSAPSSAPSERSSDNESRAYSRVRPDPSPPIERTSSGLSIAPEDEDSNEQSNYSDMKKDEQAANRVERHFAQYHKRGRDSKAERILKSLISPRSSPGREFEIDDAALNNIFCAANEIFFFGSLRNRVKWDWSDGSNERDHAQIIGSTALRRAKDGGLETLIVLSHRYLKDKRYNRRLLISTFIHELIHSYLFIRCGSKAKRFGGHTVGFRRVARLIDEWAGPDTLFLSNMEADLDDFRLAHDHDDVYRICSMQCPEDIGGVPLATPAPKHWDDIRFLDQLTTHGEVIGPP